MSFEVRRNTLNEHYRISFLSVPCEVFRSNAVTTRRKSSHLIHFSLPQTLEVSKPLCSGFRSIGFTHFFQCLRRIRMRKCVSPICFPKSALLPPRSLSAQSSSVHRQERSIVLQDIQAPYTGTDRCIQTLHGIHTPLNIPSPLR